MTRISPLKLARSGTALWLICCCLALPTALCAENNSTSDPAAIPQLSNESYPGGQGPPANDAIGADSFLLAGRWQRIVDLPRSINCLAADPIHPDVIYAGAGYQGSGSGVYRSDDAGRSWNLSSQGLPVEDVPALALDPVDPNNLYASSGVRGDIYASTDAGRSWSLRGNTDFFGGLSSKMIADPGNGATLFMISNPGGLARSSNAGRSWQHISQGLPQDQDERTGAYVLSLAVDPTDSRVVYAGTGGFVGQGHGVYKSRDGGLSWSAANRGMLDYRITCLAIDPLHPQTVYAGSDTGELFKSTDGAASWLDMADRDLFETSYNDPAIRGIALDPIRPDSIYVLADYLGLVVSHDGASHWTVLGRPESLDSPRFTALAMIFHPQPAIIVGVDPSIDDAGGWRYAVSGDSK